MCDGAGEPLIGNTARLIGDDKLLMLDLLQRCHDIGSERIGLRIDARRRTRQDRDIGLARYHGDQQRLTLFDARRPGQRNGLDRRDIGLHLGDAHLHLRDLGFRRERGIDDAAERDRTDRGLRDAICREAERDASDARHHRLGARADAEALQIATVVKDEIAGLEIGFHARSETHCRSDRK